MLRTPYRSKISLDTLMLFASLLHTKARQTLGQQIGYALHDHVVPMTRSRNPTEILVLLMHRSGIHRFGKSVLPTA